MGTRVLICLLGALFSTAFVHAAETAIPPVPTRWVTDTAGFLSPEIARSLDAQLQAYERSSGRQLLVYIGTTTGDTPIEDWAVRVFEAWKVGRKGVDDGLVLFVMAQDHRLRIEVGYGLEGQVTDAIASRIITQIITPRIQSGDRDGAALAGLDALVRATGGAGLSRQNAAVATRQQREPSSKQFSLGQLVIGGIFAVLFVILLITNPSLAMFLLVSILSGGRQGSGGGGGGGGGGFGGGGGRSGGGGASGSW